VLPRHLASPSVGSAAACAAAGAPQPQAPWPQEATGAAADEVTATSPFGSSVAATTSFNGSVGSLVELLISESIEAALSSPRSLGGSESGSCSPAEYLTSPIRLRPDAGPLLPVSGGRLQQLAPNRSWAVPGEARLAVVSSAQRGALHVLRICQNCMHGSC
jgi:hypothetical protein